MTEIVAADAPDPRDIRIAELERQLESARRERGCCPPWHRNARSTPARHRSGASQRRPA